MSSDPSAPTPSGADAPAASGGAGGGAAPESPSSPAAVAAAPTCRSCGQPMIEGQEWCLECGAARQANRWHSGRRSLLVTAALTVSLLAVAVAASYAAIVDDKPVTPTATVPGAAPPAVADAAPTTPVTPPVATTPPATTGAAVTPPVAGTTDPGTADSGGFDDFGTGSGAVVTPPVTPVTPDNGTGTGTRTGTGTGTNTTPTTPTKVQIDLSSDAASLYDPSNLQLAPDGGDPAGALGDSSTAWTARTVPLDAGTGDGDTSTTTTPTTPTDTTGTDPTGTTPTTTTPAAPNLDSPLNVGLQLDLGKKHSVGEIDFKTGTPGFTVEVYATTDETAPADITSSRWSHLTTVKNVDGKGTANGNVKGDGKQIVMLPDDTTKFRTVVLWITTAPKDGQPVKISTVRLYN